jgi:5-methylthioadenosine/S-adenosylhomocysteine deaminase
MTTILHNAQLDNKTVDITIDNGLIGNIADSGAAAVGAIDCTGLHVFPGLMNMHSHAPMTLLRGLGDDQPLDRWLNDYIWPAEKQLSDELVYEGTLRACREMLASGTTAFNDMYFHLPAMAKAVSDSGIHATLGFNVFGDGEELKEFEAVMRHCSDAGVGLSVAPHSIYTVSEKGLLRCADICERMHLPMHIHMSETRKEVEDCLREHGCRPWEYLDRLGILDRLGRNIIAAHCLHLSDEEIRLVGDHCITCVHCPNSNLKLGSGFRFPMLELIDAGANVRLGTDGSASSNNLDMIEVMKTAALLQKGWRGDPAVVPASQILGIATGGHTIAPGHAADLFLVRLNTPPQTVLSPQLSPLSTLVYATHGDNVEMTMVGGKIVYKR